MNIEKLAPFALAVAIFATQKGQLPQLIKTIRQAEFQLIQDSKASHWPPPLVAPTVRDN